MGNALQNLVTLHYTRRIYNGKFVINSTLPKASATFNPDDSIAKLLPASVSGKDSEKANDQVTPLTARMFGIYTFTVGLIRFYASYRLDEPFLYQLALWTFVIASLHFTSEMLVYKTIKFSGPQIFPFVIGPLGLFWMVSQYEHYVKG
jgi:hypothetical protein